MTDHPQPDMPAAPERADASIGLVEFGRRMSRIGAAWRREVDHDLRRFGLTEATWRPILMLGQIGAPARQTDLARALDIESTSLVRLLDVLEQGGLVARVSDPADRRSKRISITPAGTKLYRQVYAVAEAVGAEVLDAVSESERTLCLSIFERIEQALGSRAGDSASDPPA